MARTPGTPAPGTVAFLVPSQSVPPVEEPPVKGAAGLFSKTWWLFFASIVTQILPALNAATIGVAAAALALTKLYPVLVADLTLTANLALTAANTGTPAAAGQQMYLFLRQDSTGGWTVTWSSAFRGAPTGLENLASTWSLVAFVCQVDPADSLLKWWFVSLVTNQT